MSKKAYTSLTQPGRFRPKTSEDASFGAHDNVPCVLHLHEVGSSCDFTTKKIRVKQVNSQVKHVDPFDMVIKRVVNGLTRTRLN